MKQGNQSQCSGTTQRDRVGREVGWRDTCTPMLIAALLIIARTSKQLRCPLADEWIRNLWFIYTMEYYLTIKKNADELDETEAY